MTTKTLSERITEAEALLAELKRDMKPEQVSDGRPEIGGCYYYHDIHCDIQFRLWTGDRFDLVMLEVGNVYLTSEAAEREVERRKVIKILRDMAGGFKPDWSSGCTNYYLFFDHSGPCPHWDVSYQRNCAYPGQVYFVTEKAAKAAIDRLGDRLNVLREG